MPVKRNKRGGGGSATVQAVTILSSKQTMIVNSKRLNLVEAGGGELSAGIENT
jgi:hypothetical protein